MPCSQYFPSIKHFFIYVQIPKGHLIFYFPMLDLHIRIKNPPRRGDSFMNSSLPSEIPGGLHNTLPEIGKRDIIPGIEPNRIVQHYHISIPGQVLLQPFQLHLILLGDHIICIQPHPVICVCLFRNKIPGSGKIIIPWKIINLLCKSRSNFLSPI